MPTPDPVNEDHQLKLEAIPFYWNVIPAGFLDITLQIHERNRVNFIFALFFAFYRNASCSDEKLGPNQSQFEAPSLPDGHSLHEDHSLCEISSPPGGPCPKEILCSEDSPAGIMKLSQSCGFVDTLSRNDEVGGERESDKVMTREVSPTRWCAVTAWQRKQQQQQGTPGHRSEVSSIVESAVDTEDGE
jgi:hypothetical protein